MRGLIRKCWIFATTILLFSLATQAKQPFAGVYGGTNSMPLKMAAEHGVDALFPSIHWYDPTDSFPTVVKAAHAKGTNIYPSLAMAYDGFGDNHHAFAEAHPDFRGTLPHLR